VGIPYEKKDKFESITEKSAKLVAAIVKEEIRLGHI